MSTRTGLRVSLATALVLAMVSACGSAAEGLGGNIGVEDLADVAGTWRLERVYSGPPAPVAETEIVLTIEDGSIAANAGCNSMGGTASLDDSRLVVEDMFSTLMACHDAVMEQERWFSELLQSRPLMEHGGPVLTLATDIESTSVPESEVISLSFERVEATATSIP